MTVSLARCGVAFPDACGVAFPGALCCRVVLPACTAMTRRRLPLCVAVVALLGFAAHGTVPGAGQAIAYLLPPLLLLVALAARWYPGEQALLARIGRQRGHARQARQAANKYLQRPRALLPRGGCLIASSLAVRPPPTPASVALS